MRPLLKLHTRQARFYAKNKKSLPGNAPKSMRIRFKSLKGMQKGKNINIAPETQKHFWPPKLKIDPKFHKIMREMLKDREKKNRGEFTRKIEAYVRESLTQIAASHKSRCFAWIFETAEGGGYKIPESGIIRQIRNVISSRSGQRAELSKLMRVCTAMENRLVEIGGHATYLSANDPEIDTKELYPGAADDFRHFTENNVRLYLTRLRNVKYYANKLSSEI